MVDLEFLVGRWWTHLLDEVEFLHAASVEEVAHELMTVLLTVLEVLIVFLADLIQETFRVDVDRGAGLVTIGPELFENVAEGRVERQIVYVGFVGCWSRGSALGWGSSGSGRQRQLARFDGGDGVMSWEGVERCQGGIEAAAGTWRMMDATTVLAIAHTQCRALRTVGPLGVSSREGCGGGNGW